MKSYRIFHCLFKMLIIVSGVGLFSSLMAMGPESPAIPPGSPAGPYANQQAVMNHWYKRHGHRKYDRTQPCVDPDGIFIPAEVVTEPPAVVPAPSAPPPSFAEFDAQRRAARSQTPSKPSPAGSLPVRRALFARRTSSSSNLLSDGGSPASASEVRSSVVSGETTSFSLASPLVYSDGEDEAGVPFRWSEEQPVDEVDLPTCVLSGFSACVLIDPDDEPEPALPAPPVADASVSMNAFTEWHRKNSHLREGEALSANLEDGWCILIQLRPGDNPAPFGDVALGDMFDDVKNADLISQLQRAIIGEGGLFRDDQQAYCSLLMRRALAYFMMWMRTMEQDLQGQQLSMDQLQARRAGVKNHCQGLAQSSIQLGLLMSSVGRITQLQSAVANEDWKAAIEIIADALGIPDQIGADDPIFLVSDESPLGKCQARLDDCNRRCVNNLLCILAPLYKYLRDRVKIMAPPDSLPPRGPNRNETDPGGGTSPGLRSSPVLRVGVSPLSAAM